MEHNVNNVIQEISNTLDTVSGSRTAFEFENFVLESNPTPARQLLAVMREIETLYAKLNDISAKMTNPLSSMGDMITLRRASADANQRLDQLVSWYSSIDAAARRTIVGNLESEESDYWANYLGRRAAIEMLTVGRTSTETMDKMSSLPIDAFEASVKVCVRYAMLIKDHTSNVESGMGIDTAGLPTTRS